MIHTFVQVMKTLTNIFAILMATLVFYGGAGINVISYCCKDCRSIGLDVLLVDKCCEIHNHNHDSENIHNHNSSMLYCAHAERHSADKCCNMERVDFDWNSQNIAELNISISPDVYELFNNLFIDSSVHLPYICESNAAMTNGPPSCAPRDYLSLITVLLI